MLASEILVINQKKITLEQKLKLHLNRRTKIASSRNSRDQTLIYEKTVTCNDKGINDPKGSLSKLCL